MIPDPVTVADRNQNPQSVEHMDAWEDIRGRICFVEKPYEIYAEVVSCKDRRAKVQSVWKKRAYEQKCSHPNDQERRNPIKTGFVRKEKVKYGNGDKSKPHVIRYDKIFNKRYEVIQW